MGHTTTYTCDPTGRLKTIAGPDGGVTTSNYNRAARLLSVQNPHLKTAKLRPHPLRHTPIRSR